MTTIYYIGHGLAFVPIYPLELEPPHVVSFDKSHVLMSRSLQTKR